MSGIGLLTVFVLAIFVGFEVISKVRTILHTPLMSGANAIHGVILVGAILITGSARNGVELGLGLAAVVLGAINVVGGFVVTDRMLEMFKGRSRAPGAPSGPSGGSTAGAAAAAGTKSGGTPGGQAGRAPGGAA